MNTPETSTRIDGGCHCGAIRWRLAAPVGAESLPVRVCQCDFCLKHGARYTSDPRARLELQAAADDLVQRYRFGHGTADFVICRKCGTLIAAVMDGSGNARRAVLNVNTADQPKTFSASPHAMDFDSESQEERLARRGGNWVGQVIWTRNPRIKVARRREPQSPLKTTRPRSLQSYPAIPSSSARKASLRVKRSSVWTGGSK